MSAIIDFLEGIVDFFKMLIDFLVNLIADLVEFVQMLAKMPEYVGSIFTSGILPSVVVSGLTVVITTMILLRVLGRD